MPTTTKPSKDQLVALVEKIAAEEPYEFDGFTWAARPQSFYSETMGVSIKTIGRWIKEPPFVRRAKIIGATVTELGEDVKVEGGTKVCLLRIGDPSEKGPNDYKNMMAKIWEQKTGKIVTQHQKRCLYGLAKELPNGAALDVFVYALNNWQTVAGAIKIAAEARPNHKPRFLYYPNIPTIRSFYKAAVHVYVLHLQEEGKLAGSELDAALKVYAYTDPFLGYPGGGDGKKVDPYHPSGDVEPIKEFPFKEPWQPLPSGGKADAA